MKKAGFPEGYPAFVRYMRVRLIFAGYSDILFGKPPGKRSDRAYERMAEMAAGGVLYRSAGPVHIRRGDRTGGRRAAEGDPDLHGVYRPWVSFSERSFQPSEGTIEQDPAFDTNHPRYIKAWQKAADELLKTGKPFEVNTGAISRGYRTAPYPAKEIRNYIREHGGKLIMSSDAHAKENIAFRFDEWEGK